MSQPHISVHAMTDFELNEYCALKIMGWKERTISWESAYAEEIHGKEPPFNIGSFVYVAHWHPYTNLDQAFKTAMSMKDIILEFTKYADGDCRASITLTKGENPRQLLDQLQSCWSKVPSECITRACVQAWMVRNP